MLVTTYQHDYLPPFIKRYEFLSGTAHMEKDKECIEEAMVEPPKDVLDQCEKVEWTGIAPMGRLTEPRIIPTKFSDEQREAMANDSAADCLKQQPNRFLKTLRSAYPDLYERLKQMPKDEMSRRLERQRLFTTYQIDFCNMNEYPEGVYESLKPVEELSKMNASKLLERQESCSEFRANVMKELERDKGMPMKDDPCERASKPFKISFAGSSRFIASGNNSHWRSNVFAKRANFSEYMDTISKNGCVITKNNIHNHTKCTKGKHCRHQLTHTCMNLK